MKDFISTSILIILVVLFILITTSCGLFQGRSEKQIEQIFDQTRKLNIGGLGNLVITHSGKTYVYYTKYTQSVDVSKCESKVEDLTEDSLEQVIATKDFLEYITYITKKKYKSYYCDLSVFRGFYIINSQDLNTIYDAFVDLIPLE